MSDQKSLQIDPRIEQASTLPAEFYTSTSWFEESRESLFAKSWQLVADTDYVKVPGQVYPFRLLDDFVGEPLLLTRDFDDQIHCVSNVCTHRGALVVECPGSQKSLRCRYHGRRFSLCGKFEHMPEFTNTENFPGESDNLRAVPLELFERFVFASLAPAYRFEELVSSMKARVGWLPFHSLLFDPTSSREYLVRAHWALYCENYLEGFHIPYVHGGLNQIIDYSSYTTEVFAHSSLQLGLAKSGVARFELPPDSPDYGKDVGAYYFWLFPNTMFSIYPWGVSVNVVKPVTVDLTRVAFLNYLWDQPAFTGGARATMERVEREDEAIVESIQIGMRSRIYNRGRFSPEREAGVHHFQMMVASALSNNGYEDD